MKIMVRAMPSRRKRPSSRGNFSLREAWYRTCSIILGGHLLGRDRDLFRQIHEFVGQLHDPLVEGGGKHQVLALVKGWQAAQDKAQIGDKAHIEHAVGLVDHQHLDLFEAVDLLLEIVDQPARRADDDIGAVPQGVALLHVIHAAIDCLDGKTAMSAQELGVLLDLHHQFPGRGKNQGPGMRRYL